jgi:hypothetical protein
MGQKWEINLKKAQKRKYFTYSRFYLYFTKIFTLPDEIRCVFWVRGTAICRAPKMMSPEDDERRRIGRQHDLLFS